MRLNAPDEFARRVVPDLDHARRCGRFGRDHPGAPAHGPTRARDRHHDPRCGDGEVESVLGFGEHGAIDVTRPPNGLHREEDAPFRVDVQAGDRSGGELPRESDPGLLRGVPTLTDRNDGERRRHEDSDREYHDHRTEATRRAALRSLFSLPTDRVGRTFAGALLETRLEVGALGFPDREPARVRPCLHPVEPTPTQQEARVLA